MFAEACELAMLRLEQCIADSYISKPRMDDWRIGGWPSMPKRTDESVLIPAIIETGRAPLQTKDSAAI